MPTVYGVTFSLYTRKLRAFLAEKGIAYRLDFVAPGDSSPEYRRISPLGKIRPTGTERSRSRIPRSSALTSSGCIPSRPCILPNRTPCARPVVRRVRRFGVSGSDRPDRVQQLIAPRFLGQPKTLTRWRGDSDAALYYSTTSRASYRANISWVTQETRGDEFVEHDRAGRCANPESPYSSTHRARAIGCTVRKGYRAGSGCIRST